MTTSGGAPPQSEGAFDVPPSVPRLLVLPVVVTLYGLLVGVVRTPDSWPDGLIAGAPYVGGGLILLSYRWQRRHRPVLRIDSVGVISHEGQRIHSWLHTAQVWVGPLPGRWLPTPLRFPTLVVWTAAGIEFGRRARFGPTAALTLAVPTGLSSDQLAEVVRGFTTAPVLTGADVELGNLTRRLLGADDHRS